MSEVRRVYFARLAGRCLIFLACIAMYAYRRDFFDVLEGMNFFRTLSPLHFLWAVWAVDMFLQIVPIKNKVPLGSKKLFASHFKPIREKINYEALRTYIVSITKDAYKVFLLWCVLIAGIGVLYYMGLLDKIDLFMVSVFFYVCDLICVLFFCPFQFFLMNNRCCVNCRIFAWGSWMMASPLMTVLHWYAQSLFWMGVVVLICWEVRFFRHPERFWHGSNLALRCDNCTDRLCRYKKLAPKHPI